MTSKQEPSRSETERLEAMYIYEREALHMGCSLIAGVDEVGRGCIAGPVVSAAVILPPGLMLPGVDDSKKLSARKRRELAVAIKQHALTWSLSAIFPPYLDKINILNATRETMITAVSELHPQPDFVLIDALQLPDIDIKQRSIIKGDSLSLSIASASILAKVERDLLMENMELLYPGYGFHRHKGYATREHVEALFHQGVCSIHRQSFEPVKSLCMGGNYAKQPGLFDQFDPEYQHSRDPGTDSQQRRSS